MVRKGQAKRQKSLTPHVVDIKTGLMLDPVPSLATRRRSTLIWVIGFAALTLGAYVWWHSVTSRATQYETVAVVRGSLAVVVSANGSAQPISKVNISSESSGTIRKVFVDHDQNVTAGQALAELDTEKLTVAVENARAKLEFANVNATETLSSLDERRVEHGRKKALSNIISPRELQAAAFGYDRAVARHAAALASVEIAKTELKSAEINLFRATIRSPVDGKNLKRNAEVGQFIVVSLQAPVLFVIAQDLKQVEIRLDVKEADIGKIRIGQSVSFDIYSFPGASYSGEVREIRFSPDLAKGDVTYKIILQVENPYQTIRPGMSVRAEITTHRIDDAVLISNSAFGFSPSDQNNFIRKLWHRFGPDNKAQRPLYGEQTDSRQTVWVLRGGVPTAIPVKVGVTDGRRSEVLGGTISVGEQVIVGSKTLTH